MADYSLVFDVETIADLTVGNRDDIAALARSRNMTPEEYGGLCPPLARVACIAWFDVAAQALGACFDTTLYEGAPAPSVEVDDGGRGRVRGTLAGCDGEADLLRRFGMLIGQHLQQSDARLVTYNGRGFDLPVLVHRSYAQRVTEGRDLLVKAVSENRYRPVLHLDLLDAVTFGGASNRWPMAAYAIGYGWGSPKHDLDGAQVWAAVQAGRILDVVRYCAADVLATTHIYRRLHDRTPGAA
jgi:Predicted 3'-5' exonuclease related to the exonuclease domain of PolB